LHEGIDIAGDRGSAVLPLPAELSSKLIESGFGNTITIDHGNGYMSQYSHCSKLLVSAGDEVLQGERIALMGSTAVQQALTLILEFICTIKLLTPWIYLMI
jgi:murein DD-endopeptidase MepM/ murein hydrolase activator NlpD